MAQIYSSLDADRIVHGDGTYEVQPDGTFEVPDDLASFLCAQPEWERGPNPHPPERPPARKAAKPKPIAEA